MRDLVVVVPDKNIEFTIRAGLARPKALGIRAVTVHAIVDPGRDGGVRTRGAQLLRLEKRRFTHAMLIFDHEGSGAEYSAEDTEHLIDRELADTWGEHAKAIVIDPEVDAWMWGADTHLQAVAGWQSALTVREWLAIQGHQLNAAGKPVRPKEALEAAFRHSGVRRSSANYANIVSRLSLNKCKDASFLRLRATLQTWFGVHHVSER